MPTPYARADFYQAHNYQPEEGVGYLMRQIVSLAAREIEHQLAPTDLTNAQWIPLFKLYRKHATTAAELARTCHLDAGAMTRMLDRLEAKGLCHRVRSEQDRRVVNLALTDGGTVAAQGIPAVLCDAQNALLAGFDAQEFETLKSFLRRILDNAQSLGTQGAVPTQPDL
ncbi:MAG: MarR family winged helix-turn-helix transcriptional regulator [Rhodoferax sp.]